MKGNNDSNFNIFISWSTDPARKIAELLKDLLEKIFCVNPDILFFVSSSEDGGIDVGARFRNIIDDNLQKSNYGILILTKNNELRPWLMFEAGALSKNINLSRIVPILFTLKEGERKIESPLETFQHIKYSREEFEKLIFGIFKNKFGKKRLTEEQKNTLKILLDANWSNFKEDIDKILKDHELEVKKMAKTADIFDNYFYNERSFQLKQFLDSIKDSSNKSLRIIVFGGVSTDIRNSVNDFVNWLNNNTHSDIYICYEDKTVAEEREKELPDDVYDEQNINKKEEIIKRKVNEVKDFIKSLNDAAKEAKSRIHCIELTNRLSGYITVNGTDMFFTPVLHDRSSETFTYKLRDDQRSFILDYMLSKIGKSEEEKNKKLIEEIGKIKEEIKQYNKQEKDIVTEEISPM